MAVTSSQTKPNNMSRLCKVAVIGAGVSGLVAARELVREAHDVTVFEKSNWVGGTWIYDPRTESDPVGLDPAREKVHSSLYMSLRTNLPRPLMGFLDYPLKGRCFGDGREFPGHLEVRRFIEAFSRDNGLLGLVRLGAEVVSVVKGGGEMEGSGWVVKWREGEEECMEEFEAVVVCNGRNTKPRLPDITGIDEWPGKQIHSHNYRSPEAFQNQIVIVIGKGPSAIDISLEVSYVAKEVHLASNASDVEVGRLVGHDNIWQHRMVTCVNSNGQVNFTNGSSLVADVIIYCTGYEYNFPFLELNDISVDDNRVGPLYQHVFSPKHGPWLSFVGLPNKTIVFLMIELQCKWIASVLSNKATLPSKNDMMASIKEYYAKMQERGKPKRYTHHLHPDQLETYLDWLAGEAGIPPIEKWRYEMYDTLTKLIYSLGDGYRDNSEKMLCSISGES